MSRRSFASKMKVWMRPWRRRRAQAAEIVGCHFTQFSHILRGKIPVRATVEGLGLLLEPQGVKPLEVLLSAGYVPLDVTPERWEEILSTGAQDLLPAELRQLIRDISELDQEDRQQVQVFLDACIRSMPSQRRSA